MIFEKKCKVASYITLKNYSHLIWKYKRTQGTTLFYYSLPEEKRPTSMPVKASATLVKAGGMQCTGFSEYSA